MENKISKIYGYSLNPLIRNSNKPNKILNFFKTNTISCCSSLIRSFTSPEFSLKMIQKIHCVKLSKNKS